MIDYSSLDGFIFNIRALRTAFKIQFNLHDIDINGPGEIRTRQGLGMKSIRLMHVCSLQSTFIAKLLAQVDNDVEEQIFALAAQVGG